MTKKEKKNVYQIVTDQIIKELEAGAIPWKKPWVGGSLGCSKSISSKKAYRGINVFLLRNSAWWGTYKQAQKLGGQVRKGEKSTVCVFWSTFEKEDKETKEKKVIPYLKYYWVFSIEQMELPEDVRRKFVTEKDEEEAKGVMETAADAEAIVKAMPNPPKIVWNELAASYSPSADLVNIPKKNLFETTAGYYEVLFHELVHSTGHSSRLDRKLVGKIAASGSKEEVKEELVAEMGAAMLCGIAGIAVPEMIKNAASYIDSWLKIIKEDNKMVVYAASAAQKACDYITNVEIR